MCAGERFNVYTHVIGAILAVGGGAVLIVPAALRGDGVRVLSFLIYSLALLAAFATSALFHAVEGDLKSVFRRCDRVAIYVLIGATYTPVSLLCLPRSTGLLLLAGVSGLAAAGIARELVTSRRGGRVSVALYIVLGWMTLIVFRPLTEAITPLGFGLLVLGGLILTAGALLLRTQWTPRSHEVWHVLVLAGNACFFAVMFFFVA